MKIIDKIKENKIFFVIFGILTFSSIMHIYGKDVGSIMHSYYAPLYAINYNCGHSSRLLIGSIFSLFYKDRISLTAIVTALLIVYFVMCFFLSLYINNNLKKRENILPIKIYSVFLIINPTFIGLIKFLGTTDMFWIFLVIASFLVVDKKFLRWLVPVFCVICLAIHEFFSVAYLPVIACAVFYQFAKKPKASNLIYVIISALICGAAAVYFLIFGKETLTMNSEEMIKYACDRIDFQGEGFSDFYVNGMFFWDKTEYSAEYQLNLLGYIKYAFEIFVLNDIRGLLLSLISNFLTASPFLYVISKSIKIEKNSLKKFSLICFFIVLFISNFLILMSTDTTRFSEHSLINLIFIIIFFLKENDITIEQGYNCLTTKVSANKTLFATIALIATTVVFSGVLF